MGSARYCSWGEYDQGGKYLKNSKEKTRITDIKTQQQTNKQTVPIWAGQSQFWASFPIPPDEQLFTLFFSARSAWQGKKVQICHFLCHEFGARGHSRNILATVILLPGITHVQGTSTTQFNIRPRPFSFALLVSFYSYWRCFRGVVLAWLEVILGVFAGSFVV